MRIIKGPIYVVGDIHGNPTSLIIQIELNPDYKDCTFVLLGDVGIFKYRDYKRYLSLDNLCNDRNINVLALRGNHDNPSFFSPDNKDPIIRKFKSKFKKIELIDLETILTDYGTILLYPGAISRDRCVRKSFNMLPGKVLNPYKGGDWWYDEECKIIPESKVDYILSHIGPLSDDTDFVIPECFLKYDTYLSRDLENEQNKLKQILLNTQPRKWVFGHYHQDMEYVINNTNCICLGIDTIREL